MTDGCAVLLLEDEPLVLMDLEFAAEDQGCRPLSATCVTKALIHIESNRVDVAVLDVTLSATENCVPVARALETRGIPYLLHSGDLDRQNEVVRSLDAELIAKPADADLVIGKALEMTEWK